LKKESPMSFTEFSYSLLQGYDYLHLYEQYGCTLQVGGSDQWSNILAGVEFIQRKSRRSTEIGIPTSGQAEASGKEKEVYALTWPLLVNKATGRKFGKSETGTVWLDAGKTSIFQFYQFWFNIDDDIVQECLLKMTLLGRQEIDAVMEMHRRDKGDRHAQKLLARTVTGLVHGIEAAGQAEQVSDTLFGGASLADLSEEARAELQKSAPSYEVQEGQSIIDALVGAQLASSRREARQFLLTRAVSLNQNVITDTEYQLGAGDFSAGSGSSSGGQKGLAILQRGKQKVCVLVLK
jgi:tyrosyl-tRNA synthetase